MIKNLDKLDKTFMLRALALARRGSGFVFSNPLVGAVIVNAGKIVGYGWHQKAGGHHAEINALKMAGQKAKEGTLYVTLEPCNHHGKTPPCVDALIQVGIKRVVIAMRDPNTQVTGGGYERLKEAGIIVKLGVLGEIAEELNLIWLHWISTGKPYVVLKLAASLDGKIGNLRVGNQVISSAVSKAQVQRLRRYFQAVMVGAGTVRIDDPYLTNRSGKGNDPIPILVDSKLSFSATQEVSKFNMFAKKSKGIIFTTRAAFKQKKEIFSSTNIDLIAHDRGDGSVDLSQCLADLGKRGVQSVLCEGGSKLAYSLLKDQLCQRLIIYYAPKFIGSTGVSLLDFKESFSPEMKLLEVSKVGNDIRVIYELGGNL